MWTTNVLAVAAAVSFGWTRIGQRFFDTLPTKYSVVGTRNDVISKRSFMTVRIGLLNNRGDKWSTWMRIAYSYKRARDENNNWLAEPRSIWNGTYLRHPMKPDRNTIGPEQHRVSPCTRIGEWAKKAERFAKTSVPTSAEGVAFTATSNLKYKRRVLECGVSGS